MYKECGRRTTSSRGCWQRFAVSSERFGEGQTERANGELVSGNYFEVLGVRPALGRVSRRMMIRFRRVRSSCEPGYWKRQFGADSAILNKRLT